MTTTLRLWTEFDGVKSTIDPTLPCLGCGVEPERAATFIRTLREDGADVKVRVGYHCSCGTVVVDGLVQGATLSFDR